MYLPVTSGERVGNFLLVPLSSERTSVHKTTGKGYNTVVIDHCGNDQHCMFHMCGSERDSSCSLEALFSSMLAFMNSGKERQLLNVFMLPTVK